MLAAAGHCQENEDHVQPIESLHTETGQGGPPGDDKRADGRARAGEGQGRAARPGVAKGGAGKRKDVRLLALREKQGKHEIFLSRRDREARGGREAQRADEIRSI